MGQLLCTWVEAQASQQLRGQFLQSGVKFAGWCKDIAALVSAARVQRSIGCEFRWAHALLHPSREGVKVSMSSRF